jgi:hypothetical protein
MVPMTLFPSDEVNGFEDGRKVVMQLVLAPAMTKVVETSFKLSVNEPLLHLVHIVGL